MNLLALPGRPLASLVLSSRIGRDVLNRTSGAVFLPWGTKVSDWLAAGDDAERPTLALSVAHLLPHLVPASIPAADERERHAVAAGLAEQAGRIVVSAQVVDEQGAVHAEWDAGRLLAFHDGVRDDEIDLAAYHFASSAADRELRRLVAERRFDLSGVVRRPEDLLTSVAELRQGQHTFSYGVLVDDDRPRASLQRSQLLSAEHPPKLWIASADHDRGMSGAFVLASDAKILGMFVALLLPPHVNDEENAGWLVSAPTVKRFLDQASKRVHVA